MLLNPKKGFIDTSNNAIVPQGITETGIGSTMTGNYRANHITNSLSNSIKLIQEGKSNKLDLESMVSLQNNVKSPFAEVITSELIKLIKQNDFTHKCEKKKMEKLIGILSRWNYEMDKNSKEALIFSVWISEIQKTFLNILIENKIEREAVVFSKWGQFLVRNMISKWSSGKNLNHSICLNEENINMNQPCIYNIKSSLLKTYNFLVDNLGENEVMINCYYIRIIGNMDICMQINTRINHLAPQV